MFLKKIIRLASIGLRKIDLFSTDQFIRFNQQPQYATKTGGAVSLVLMVAIIILFYNKGVETFNRSIINSSTSSQIDTDPEPISVITSPNGGFMFAVGIFGLNLSDPNVTFFSLNMYQYFYSPILQVINSTQVPLVQCTQNHFAFNNRISQQYHKFDVSQYLCPPLGYEFTVGGSFTSQIFSQIVIYVQKCNTSLVSNCASEQAISDLMNAMGEFKVVVPFVNTLVNPDNQKYLVQDLESRNYFGFTTSYGVIASAQIAQYQIDTDTSLFPYTQIQTDIITTVPNLFDFRNVLVSNGTYAEIDFFKSAQTKIYTRSFAKLDDYFSYIGGLIGSLLSVFFMMQSYSERSFLIDIAEIVLEKNNAQFSLKGFNFIQNFGVVIKKVLNFIHIDACWPRGSFLIEAMEQMEEQLDIFMLVRKITFLQDAIESILSEHQLNALYLKDKKSLQMIKKQRKRYKVINALFDQDQWTILQSFQKQDQFSQSISQCQDDKNMRQKNEISKVKSSVEKVLDESKKNNQISQRILKNIDPLVLERLGIVDFKMKKEIEMKKVLEVEAQNTSTNLVRHSKNAVGNEHRQPKSTQKSKQVVVDNID